MAMFEQPRGYLLPIGGAEDKKRQRAILRAFLQLCGGSAAHLVVIPAASGFALETGDRYCKVFADLGAASVNCLHIRDRYQANDQANATALERATGIFLTGGDQVKLISLIGGTRLAEMLRSRHASGVHVAGTSAGASALSRQMIAFGRSGSMPSQRMVQLASGLGLTEALIIDQHFSQRDRLGRLLTAIALNPGMMGVGVDEDTGLLITPDGTGEVIGSGTVTLVDGSAITYTDIHAVKQHKPVVIEGVDVQVFYPGDCISLQPLAMSRSYMDSAAD